MHGNDLQKQTHRSSTLLFIGSQPDARALLWLRPARRRFPLGPSAEKRESRDPGIGHGNIPTDVDDNVVMPIFKLNNVFKENCF